MLTLSLLAHAATLLLLILLLPSRTQPIAVPSEASVALFFEPAPTIVPPTADMPPTSAPPPPASMPVQDTPLVPEAPSPVTQAPTPTPPATVLPHRPPARALASPTAPRLPAPAETQSAALGSALLTAVAPLVPPRPVAGMETNQAPGYPDIARRRGEQGRVLLRVNVSADGTPLDVELAETSGHPSLDSAALSAVRQWRFVPATEAGRFVPAIAEVPIRFRLDN
jgi:protein TonB